MEPTAPNNDGEPMAVKKPEPNSAPTQIVINSVDGSIMNAGDDTTKTQPNSAPEISTETPAETPVEATATNEPEQTSEPATSNVEVSEPQPASVAEEAPQEETLSQSVETSNTEVPAPADQVAQVQDVADGTTTAAENPMAIPPQPVKKSGAPKAAVIVAVIIGLALMAGAVFAYMKSQQKTATHSDNHTNETTQTNATTEEQTLSDYVDNAATEIDAEIEKTTGDKDIPASDSVNDQTLGL